MRGTPADEQALHLVLGRRDEKSPARLDGGQVQIRPRRRHEERRLDLDERARFEKCADSLHHERPRAEAPRDAAREEARLIGAVWRSRSVPLDDRAKLERAVDGHTGGSLGLFSFCDACHHEVAFGDVARVGAGRR